ncbi:acyltransferase family protein [Cupriavidus sp. YAF13]|uniref:acyltransferase family protein n=1 Tax=Cupriavidus sp. YAF13 TaxID=3233075 RepID=UPI003F90EFD5
MKLDALEGVRGFAAVYVFLHHLNPLQGTGFEPLLKFGQEAVILFFLVSGFVIYYSKERSGINGSGFDFIIKRAARIYPLFLVSLALAALSGFISGGADCFDFGSFVGNILMLQDIGGLKSGTWVEPFCSNSPLWSLSYEWWFYISFAIIYFHVPRISVIRQRTIVAVVSIFGTASFLLMPGQPFLFASYFSIWWAGLELAREYIDGGKLSLRQQAFSISMMAINAALWAVPVVHAVQRNGAISFGLEPVLELRHFLSGIAFVVLAVLLNRVSFFPGVAVRIFSKVAPISFGIYITHQPIITIARSLGVVGFYGFFVVAISVVVVAYLLEIVAQPRIVKLLFATRTTTIPAAR